MLLVLWQEGEQGRMGVWRMLTTFTWPQVNRTWRTDTESQSAFDFLRQAPKASLAQFCIYKKHKNADIVGLLYKRKPP